MAMIGGDAASLGFGFPKSESRKVEKKWALFFLCLLLKGLLKHPDQFFQCIII